MSSYQELVSVLKEILTNRFYPKPEFIKALLGDGLGNVVVPGRPDFNYVRFNRSANETFEVFNKEVSQPVDGTPVLVGTYPWQPGLVQVVGIDWESYIQTSWGNNYASIQAHAPTHEWPDFIPGSDYMRVFARAIYPLQGYGGGTGSMSFTAYPYQYDYTGTNSYWPGTPAVSLGPTRPPTGTMRYMGVYLNPATNQLGVVTGASVTFAADGEPPYPAWPLNVYPVAYARVYGGQAFFVERDIKDARRLWNTTLMFTGTSGGGGGAPSGPAGGDLTGTYPDPRVVSLNTIPIIGAPTNNQFLMFTGSAWRPTTQAAGGGGWPFDNVRTVSQTDANADHATIAAAITAASAGDVILLDAETFTVTAAIAVNKAVAIIGHPLGTIVQSSTANISIFNVTAAARLLDLTITHTGATLANNCVLVDAANVVIKNCNLTSSGAATINTGIFHSSGTGLRVEDCFITVSGATTSYGYSTQLASTTAEIYGGKISGTTQDIQGSVSGATMLLVKPVLTNGLISFTGTIHGAYFNSVGQLFRLGIGVAAYHSTTQTLTNGSAANAMELDSERRDDAAFHDTVTNNSRLTVPTGYAGWYVISGGIGFPADSTGTYRQARIRLNGSTIIAANQQIPSAAQVLRINISTLYYLANADYVELIADHNATTNLTSVQTANANTELRMVRLG